MTTYLSQYQYEYNDKCLECMGTEYTIDPDDQSFICVRCGLVSTHRQLLFGDSADYIGGILHKKHTLYQRRYHIRERLAQWLGIGPAPPDWLCVAISKFLPPDADISHLSQTNIGRMCGLVRMEKYAERWITIRKKVASLRGWDALVPYPTDPELSLFEDMWGRASGTFDMKLYKPGKRSTWKDSGTTSYSKLARHNFNNFNYAAHQIFMLMGLRKKLDAHFYWRLPKTKKVLEELEMRWKIICDNLGWPCFTRLMLIDTSYALDPPAFVVPSVFHGTNRGYSDPMV